MKAAKAKTAATPKGFRALTGGMDGKTWAPEIGGVLQGKVMSKKQLDAKAVGRENAKKGDKVWIVSVADADGELHAVWESKALEEFCATVKPGQNVFLRLDGVKKLGKRRFKQFTAGVVGK